MKFIHFTDTHLRQPGQKLHGLNPQDRLQSCIESINRHHGDAEFCVITGDLADQGEDQAYGLMVDQLSQCKIPCHLLIGNHDHRAKFKLYFPHVAPEGFVQYTVKTSVGIFIMLDTVMTESHSGAYCERRQEWLRETLAEHSGESVYLFMHHPPFDIHLPALDRIGLTNKQAFSDIVHPHTNIRHLFFGHAHRPICGNWQGISFSTLRGTNHQVVLNFTEPRLAFCDEAPEYAVVFLSDESIVIHSHAYLHETPTIS